MKKNFHWLVFAIVTIAFWRTSDNLLFEHKSIIYAAGGRSESLRDLERDGWEIESQATYQSTGSRTYHLKRCKLYRLFD